MSGRGSPNSPKMVDGGKVAVVGSFETAAPMQHSIEAARREAEDTRMKQLIQEQLFMFFTIQETPMPPTVAGKEGAIPGGKESRAGGQKRNVPVEVCKLLAAACVTDGITPAFGQRLEAIVHSMEAIDDGHRFCMAYLRKHWDTHMHHGDTFALDLVRERYLCPGTENPGHPSELTELLELYKDRVYDANIASAAKTTARQRFGGAFRSNDRDRDGS
eukprot:jgi/Tetstr1/427399/TSEL_017563.t1